MTQQIEIFMKFLFFSKTDRKLPGAIIYCCRKSLTMLLQHPDGYRPEEDNTRWTFNKLIDQMMARASILLTVASRGQHLAVNKLVMQCWRMCWGCPNL